MWDLLKWPEMGKYRWVMCQVLMFNSTYGSWSGNLCLDSVLTISGHQVVDFFPLKISRPRLSICSGDWFVLMQ